MYSINEMMIESYVYCISYTKVSPCVCYNVMLVNIYFITLCNAIFIFVVLLV